MTPRPGRENCYLSRYWPSLNGAADDISWTPDLTPQTDREISLLDVVGAYDLLLMQGLTEQGATTRLGLTKTRDELVKELDSETARRLSILQGESRSIAQIPPAPTL